MEAQVLWTINLVRIETREAIENFIRKNLFNIKVGVSEGKAQNYPMLNY